MQVKDGFKYAEQVASGQLPACKSVRDAVARFDRDLQNPRYRMNLARVEQALKLFGLMRFTSGVTAGQPIELEPWQLFMLVNLLGFEMSETGFRRFNTSFLEVARKNGKSTSSALLGIYFLLTEKGTPEIYCAANSREQAGIVYKECKRLVSLSPALKRHLRITRQEIESNLNLGFIRPLAAKTNNLDGLSPSLAICDEIHASRNNGAMLNVLKSGQGARAEPLLSTITTAGFDSGFAYEYHQVAEKIASGEIESERFFALVYQLDPGERELWTKPEYWIKANPNLGVSLSEDYLRSQCNQALNTPHELVNFKTKHLNMWAAEGSTSWLSLADWNNAERFDPEALRGWDCYAGLDLASVSDLTALALLFTDGDKYLVMMRFYCPEAAVQKARNSKRPYDPWVRDGSLMVNPGNTTDYNYIKQDILELNERYNIVNVNYDRWNASQLIIDLEAEGFDCVPVGMGFRSMSAPMKAIQKAALDKRIVHNDHPVLAWCVEGTVADVDPAGNIKPSKKHSKIKIDGTVALIMAWCPVLDAELQNAEVWVETLG